MGAGHYRASLLAYRRVKLCHVQLHRGPASCLRQCRTRRKALELTPGDEEIQAALSVAQSVLQQTQQQKYSSPDSALCTTP